MGLRMRPADEGPTMARSGLGVAAALICCAGFFEPASACEGTQVVFEDKFADDSGGWAINQDVEVKDGSFTFKLPPDAMQSDLNVTYTVNDEASMRRLIGSGVAGIETDNPALLRKVVDSLGVGTRPGEPGPPVSDRW